MTTRSWAIRCVAAFRTDEIGFRTAVGYDWYIDVTPDDDVEFTESASPTRLSAAPQGAPAGRLDLLSAVSHEMGHQFALADS